MMVSQPALRPIANWKGPHASRNEEANVLDTAFEMRRRSAEQMTIGRMPPASLMKGRREPPERCKAMWGGEEPARMEFTNLSSFRKEGVEWSPTMSFKSSYV